jgi:hypothetical protein
VGRTLVAIGAVVIVAGGAAIGYAVTRKASHGMSPEQNAAMATAVGQLEGDIKAARVAVQIRAGSLSTPSAVRAAILTDKATAADLVKHGDLVPAAGEVLELGRIDKAKPAGDKDRLIEVLRLPESSLWMAHGGKPGSYAELVHQDTMRDAAGRDNAHDDKLVITEVAEVVPTEQPEKFGGFLSVTRPLQLGPAIAPLIRVGLAGKLVLGGNEAPIGVMPAGTATHEHPLAAQDGAKLVFAVPPPHSMLPLPALIAGIGAALVGFLLLLLGLMGDRDPVAERVVTGIVPVPGRPVTAAGTPPPPQSAIGSAETQLSQPGVALAATSLHDAVNQPIAAANLGAGTMIGRWEVVSRLGSGGMADVYLAQAKGDGGFEKLVAVKVMHSHLARNQRAVDHFLDEARLAARIHHPNVVAIQDLGKIGEDYVIVMEYVDGVDLERLLTASRAGERPLPLAVGLGILCRICDGLDAAHHATSQDGEPLGIVHRDVKSANVLVSRQGVVKVVDFGIAKAAKQVHYTIAGETKGTPSMMAPEQRVGEQVDVRADVYSVAAVGYELVTGRAVNLDLAALAHLGIDNWPHLPVPSTLRTGLPPELDQILLGAMAFERDKRPADCAAFEALCQAVMKAHNLTASDKDIARWIDGELRHLGPSYASPTPGLSRSPVA